MLSAYITAAMHRATYELLPDDEGFVGVIPGLQGVLGHAETLEASRDELQSVLEAWILFRLRRGLTVPVIDALDMNQPYIVEEAA